MKIKRKVKELENELKKLEATQTRIARRNARRKCFGIMRSLHYHIDKLYPPILKEAKPKPSTLKERKEALKRILSNLATKIYHEKGGESWRTIPVKIGGMKYHGGIASPTYGIRIHQKHLTSTEEDLVDTFIHELAHITVWRESREEHNYHGDKLYGEIQAIKIDYGEMIKRRIAKWFAYSKEQINNEKQKEDDRLAKSGFPKCPLCGRHSTSWVNIEYPKKDGKEVCSNCYGKPRKNVEYRVTELDEYGDGQDVYHFDTLVEALKEAKTHKWFWLERLKETSEGIEEEEVIERVPKITERVV